jgi:beta-glucanase (GH16 family)
LFEAKIKVSDIKNVMHAFWMLSDTSLPHIDIAKTSTCGKLKPGHIMGSEDKPVASNSKVKGLDWTKDFFIYSLDWTADKLVWKINDVVVKTQTDNIPQEPMYLILSSGVSNANMNVNAAMEIDWVKCYQKC